MQVKCNQQPVKQVGHEVGGSEYMQYSRFFRKELSKEKRKRFYDTVRRIERGPLLYKVLMRQGAALVITEP